MLKIEFNMNQKIVLMNLLIVMSFECALQFESGHESGRCPLVKLKRSFNINKFLGVWFVVRRDRIEADCILQNVTTDGLKYFLTEIREPLAKGIFTTLKNEIKFDKKRQSQLYLGTRFGPMQALSILMTDYLNYAVTYWCERKVWGHKRTISILSRNNTLSQTYLTKIYRNVRKMGLSTSQLSIINQEECEEPQLNENGFAINKPWNHRITDYSHEAINSDDDKYWR